MKAWFRSKRSLAQWIYIALLVIMIANLGVMLLALWNTPNLFQVDLSGHLASGLFFGQMGMHQFNDTRFLGYIQNLFYPPLEDVLYRIVSCIVHTPLLAFQWVISLVLCGYVGASLLLSTRWRSVWTKIVYMLVVLIFLNLDKGATMMYYQGLSYFDLLFTGLTSQILGGSFLFLLLTMLLSTRSSRYLWIFVLGCAGMLSHLVVGPVMLLVIGMTAFYQKDKKLVAIILGILLSVSFFFVPFVLSSEFMTSAKITFVQYPLFAIILALVTLGLAIYGKQKKFMAIASSGVLLIGVAVLYQWTQRWGISLLPPFHYYRFVAPAIVLLLVAGLGTLDVLWSKDKKRYGKGVVVSLIIISSISLIIAISVGVSWLKKYRSMMSTFPLHTQNMDIVARIDDGKRVFTIDPYRSMGFNLDSVLPLSGYPLRFVKGLFWESNLSNVFINSYIAMLLDDTHIVTDYIQSQEHSCIFINQLWDYAVNDLAIGWVIVAPIDWISYLTPDQKLCYQEILAIGTPKVQWQNQGIVHINNIPYTLFKLIPHSGVYNDLVIGYSHPTIDVLDRHQPFFQGNIFDKHFALLEQDAIDHTIYSLESIPYQPLPVVQQTNTIITGTLKKLHHDTYEILLPTDEDIRFTLSLNYFPGMSLVDQQDNELPLFRGNHYIIAKGHGKMLLSYDKPKYFLWGYIGSFMSFVVVAFLLYRYNTRKK